jgi:uncharacterized membrane protein YoaK (UPF0700 family)
MLRKFSNSRTLQDNIMLGVLTAFSAGMVNIASILLFFAFTSNVTGHFAILASEMVRGNLYPVAVVFGWIFLFFLGSFTSNLIVINFNKRNAYVAHSAPIILEILCLIIVGFYGQHYYQETLVETEFLLSLMLFAMGLQNGLTASISNFAVKTTHLTGTTTDLGILFSLFTKKEYRLNKELVGKAKLLLSICFSYLAGAVFAGFVYFYMGFAVFYVVSLFLVVVILYDFYKLSVLRYIKRSKVIRRKLLPQTVKLGENKSLERETARKREKEKEVSTY